MSGLNLLVIGFFTGLGVFYSGNTLLIEMNARKTQSAIEKSVLDEARINVCIKTKGRVCE